MLNNSIHDKEKIIAEIQALITDEVLENKQLEYKSELPTQQAESLLKGLLAPVCAFLNTNDGYIIYGVKDLEGKPVELTGISLDKSIDATKLQLLNWCQSNIEHRISGMDVAIHELPTTNKYIVIVKIAKSWYGPHREKRTNRFYVRTSASSEAMDIAQIRDAFNLSGSLLEKVNDFKTKRLIDIESKQTITPIQDGAKIVLHVIALSNFMTGQHCEIRELDLLGNLFVPQHHNYSRWSKRIVLEGLLGCSTYGDDINRYDLLFRHGIFESVLSFPPHSNLRGESESAINAIFTEGLVVSEIKRFVEIFKKLNFCPPIFISLSYVGLAGYSLQIPTESGLAGGYYLKPFGRNMIQLSSEIINSFDTSIENIMRPLFNSVWNCCGLPCSAHYDTDENWIEKIF